MVRAGANPWLATLGAVVFSLYGAGYADISYAFNVGFDGSVFFGLVFLLAVDHPARSAGGTYSGRSPAWPASCARASAWPWSSSWHWPWPSATACAGHCWSPPRWALVYVIWFATVGRSAYSTHSTIAALFRFVVLGTAKTFSSLGHSPLVGALLAVMLALGIVATVRSTSLAELRLRYAPPAALLVGAAAFLVIVGFGRADNALPSSETYAASRYLYIAAALVLPPSSSPPHNW